MIVCRECGVRNPSGTTFCENRDCGAFLEWSGDAFPTESLPQVNVLPSRGRGASSSGPQRIGPAEVGVTVNLKERELQVEPGETTSCEINVSNDGRVVDQYTIQVFGDAARWTTVEPPSINLVPDAEGSARITFHPPRRSDVVAGTRPFRIVVTSREDLRASAFADGIITVAPFHEVVTQLRPQYAEGQRATYEAGVQNLGNAPVAARFDAADARRALELRISPPTVSVPPGGWGSARIDVQPRNRPLSGPPMTYPFRVVAQAGWDTPRNMDAQFVYKPMLPPFGRNWLVVLRLVLTLLGALLMLLGAFSDWVPDLPGTELTYEGYVEGVFDADVPSPPEGLSDTFVSLGLVAIVLAVVAVLGLFTQTGLPTRVAGGLGLVLMLIFVFTVNDADIDVSGGPYVVLIGALMVLIGGIMARTITTKS